MVQVYLRDVRMLDKSEYVGIIRQTLQMMEKGITLSDIAQAITNYTQSEWVMTQIPQKRMHIRKFFRLENIKTWANNPDVTRNRSVVAMEKLNTAPPPMPVWKVEPEEEEDECVEP